MKRIYLGTMEAAQAVGNEVAIRRQQFELRMDAERAKAFSEAIDKARIGLDVKPVKVEVAPVEVMLRRRSRQRRGPRRRRSPPRRRASLRRRVAVTCAVGVAAS